jgi:hypothetical protein
VRCTHRYTLQTPGTLIHCHSASIGPCDSLVGIFEIAVVGVGDNHTSAKAGFTVHPDV